MESAITAFLTYIYLVFLGISLIVAGVKGRRVADNPAKLDIFFAEIVFYAVGISGIWFGFFHAFAPGVSASSIGWSPSPFEWELAFATFGLAAIALMQLWAGRPYRIAATIVLTIFYWGAAIQHINQIICCHNYAPNNGGIILYWDLFLPVILIALAITSRAKTPVT